MADAAPILLHSTDGVLRIVLHRPERRNALSQDLVAAVTEALAAASRDPDVRCVVLAGAGLGFCAGADLTETAALASAKAISDHASRMSDLLASPRRCRKPVIAEVHGFALGAGFGLALSCDIVLCAADAKLGYPEVAHGMLPALVVPSLVNRAGYSTAFKLLATAEPISGRTAEAMGLVTCVEAQALATEAESLAQHFAARSAEQFPALKQLLSDIEGVPPSRAGDLAREANVQDRLRRLRGRG
jgi:enoyl-CoA hydratase/carnithine racemase